MTLPYKDASLSVPQRVEDLLARMTLDEKVGQLKELFPTGLVLSPSHEAILPDIPPANIEAMARAANA